MKIFVLDREYEFENKEKYLGDIIDVIKKESNKSGYYFAYLVVDGVKVHYNFKDFIEKNLDSIDCIKVVSMTFKEMISSSLFSIKEYIDEQIKHIPIVSSELGKGKLEEDSLADLDDILEGIGWIIEYFKRVDSTQNLDHVIPDYYAWNEYAVDVYRLGEIVDDIEDAVSDRDSMYLSRIIGEDILEVFLSMTEKLEKIYQ